MVMLVGALNHVVQVNVISRSCYAIPDFITGVIGLLAVVAIAIGAGVPCCSASSIGGFVRRPVGGDVGIVWGVGFSGVYIVI